MKKTTIFSLLFLIVGSVFAEVRIWNDKNGNSYEAEYVRELFDKLTLRTTDGKEVRLAVEDFSEHDQKYLRVMVPPNLAVDFQKKSWTKEKPKELWDMDFDTIIVTRANVTITKESKRPFTSGLRAELFLIAKEVDGRNYILLSKTDSSFLLVDENENTHVFKSVPVETQNYLEYNEMQRRGEEYEGYLVVVSDTRGNIIQTKTDISRGWIEQPDVIKNLRELSLRGAGSLRSRHFDKTGSKVKTTRPKFYFPTRL